MMKNNILFILLFCFSVAAAQDDERCRLKKEQLAVLCNNLEREVKEKKVIAVEVSFVITAKNAGELEIIKNWGGKNGYFTEPSAAISNALAIRLKKYPGTFSCATYYTIYSHIEQALDKMGVGCFATPGLKFIQLEKLKRT